MPLDLSTGFYESSSKPLAVQECVNWFPKVPETVGALATRTLFFSPGITAQATGKLGNGQGGAILEGELYAVCFGILYKIDSSFARTNLGTINSTDRVVMVSNGETIMIQVPGGSGYWYDTTNGLQEITDATYQSFQAQPGGVLSVAVKDGYFVFVTRKEAPGTAS